VELHLPSVPELPREVVAGFHAGRNDETECGARTKARTKIDIGGGHAETVLLTPKTAAWKLAEQIKRGERLQPMAGSDGDCEHYSGSVPVILALLTDLYQLTMGLWLLEDRRAEDEAVFHLFFRKNPFKGGYAVACDYRMSSTT